MKQLSCLCQVENDCNENLVYVRSLDRKNEVCLAYMSVCDECLAKMKKYKVIIDDPDKFWENYEEERKSKNIW